MNLLFVFVAFIGIASAQYRFVVVKKHTKRFPQHRPHHYHHHNQKHNNGQRTKFGQHSSFQDIKTEDSYKKDIFEYQSVDAGLQEDYNQQYYNELEKLQSSKYEDILNHYQGSHKIETLESNPLAKEIDKYESYEDHSPAEYAFKYSVNDPHTGDIKSHEESRHGDQVKGFYTLKQPDGTTREVHYTAGKYTGFNAVVTNKGKSKHPTTHPVREDHD